MPSNPESKASGQKPTAKTAEGGTDGVLGRLSELGWQALPAIGSAIGFVGFVAVIGTAIEWIRFDAAHLPATQAVLAVPKQELVIIGALALAAFVIGAVLAVLLVYLIDNNGDATPGTARGLVAVGVVEMAVTLFFIEVDHPVAYVLLGIWLLIIGLSAAYVVAAVMRNFTHRSELQRARTKLVEARNKLDTARAELELAEKAEQAKPDAPAQTAREQAFLAVLPAQRAWEGALREWEKAHAQLLAELPKSTRAQLEQPTKTVSTYLSNAPSGDELEQSLNVAELNMNHVFRALVAHLQGQLVALGDKLKQKGEEADGDESGAAKGSSGPTGGQPVDVRLWWVSMISIAVVVGLIVYGIVLVATEDSFSWVVVLLAVAVVLAMMNLFVARATEKFAWYGMSVFFSVLLFGAALTIARTLNRPSVQPIALVRKSDDVGICGVFITQTNERVYIGKLALPGHRPGLIFWVPTSEVDLVDVGQSEPINSQFPELAVAMLQQLYKDRAEEPAQTLKNTTVTEVTNGAKAGETTTTTSETPPPKKVRPMPYPRETVGAGCTSS